MWAYDLDLWPWRSPRLSVIHVLVLCWSTKCTFWWYCDYLFSIYGPLGQHGSDWSRDLAILTFDLGGHGACGWCGSSSSIRIPSLKFVGLAIRKIGRYGARCVSALMALVTLIFDCLTLKLICELHQRWGTFLPNLGTVGLWVLESFAMYATDGHTDERTGGQKQRLLPPSLRGPGHNKILIDRSYGLLWCSELLAKLTVSLVLRHHKIFPSFIEVGQCILASRVQTDTGPRIRYRPPTGSNKELVSLLFTQPFACDFFFVLELYFYCFDMSIKVLLLLVLLLQRRRRRRRRRRWEW